MKIVIVLCCSGSLYSTLLSQQIKAHMEYHIVIEEQGLSSVPVNKHTYKSKLYYSI